MQHEADLTVRCCRAALDLVRASRHRLARWLTSGFPMRNLFKSLRALGPGTLGSMTVALALLACSHAAEAANPIELNFGLFGPKYDGRVAECERALPTITSQFQEKEGKFWNSALTITAFGGIREIAFRPWQSDN